MWELNHKKAEHWRTDTFELWSWKRLLRVPWTARRSNQSILKEINLDYSLEGLMLKLNLHYFDHLIQRANSLKKTLILGKIKGRKRGDDRGWDGWMASLTQWTWVWTSSRRWSMTGKPGVLQAMGITKSQRGLRYWTTTILKISDDTLPFNSRSLNTCTWIWKYPKSRFLLSKQVLVRPNDGYVRIVDLMQFK